MQNGGLSELKVYYCQYRWHKIKDIIYDFTYMQPFTKTGFNRSEKKQANSLLG